MILNLLIKKGIKKSWERTKNSTNFSIILNVQIWWIGLEWRLKDISDIF
jgi:hypothetical protein